MKKVVLSHELHDEKEKRKAMAKVSGMAGVISVAIDMKAKKMTVIGDVDAVEVTSKLRKLCGAQMETVEDNKEEKEKKPADDKETKEGGGEKSKVEKVQYPWPIYQNPYLYPTCVVHENPNPCVIL